MPTTVNGIGTHYYGRKNVEVIQGECQACHAQTKLTSYDTRLWFVVVFIPLIPLGRKRILKECASCRRHFVADLRQWDSAKQMSISGAEDAFRTEPSAENAISLHTTYLQFQYLEKANELSRQMESQFAENAKVLAYLGDYWQGQGKTPQALPLYQKAFDLRPDLPESRVGLALNHISQNQLDAARPYLDFLEKSGSGQLYSLYPLEQLAIAYQAQGRHEDALTLYSHLLRELPAVAQHVGFRKAVGKSEKKLGRKTSILPQKKWSWRSPGEKGITLFQASALGGVIGLLILAAVAQNFWLKNHRTVYLVNQSGSALSLKINDQPPITLARGMTEHILPEGKHKIHVQSPLVDQFDIEFRDTFMGRWSGDRALVIDPTKEAVLVLQKAIYAKNPPPAPAPQVYYGRNFYSLADVTHPFKTLPPSIQVKGSSTTTQTQLSLFKQPKEMLIAYLQEKKPAEAMNAAWLYLSLGHSPSTMVYQYTSVARQLGQEEKARENLQKGLGQKLDSIDWHRAYQELLMSEEQEKSLIAFYDSVLKTNTSHSGVLYLRGRISNDSQEARQFFERAQKADDKNRFAYLALGFHWLSRADYARALDNYQLGLKIDPQDSQLQEMVFICRLGLRENEALQKELEDKLKTSKKDFVAVQQLCLLYGMNKEVSKAFALIRSHFPEAEMEPTRIALMVTTCEAAGDFAQKEQILKTARVPWAKHALFQTMVESGDVDKALTLVSAENLPKTESLLMLSTALALELYGKKEEGARWLKQALSALVTGGQDERKVARLLSASQAPTQEDLDNIVAQPIEKAIYLATLAHRFPEKKQVFLEQAKSFNVIPSVGYYVVKKALDQ